MTQKSKSADSSCAQALAVFLNVCTDARVCADGSPFDLYPNRMERILKAVTEADLVCLSENRNYKEKGPNKQYETLMLKGLHEKGFEASSTWYNNSALPFAFIAAVRRGSGLKMEKLEPIYVYQDDRWHADQEGQEPTLDDVKTRSLAPYIVTDKTGSKIVVILGHAPLGPVEFKQKYLDEAGKYSIELRDKFSTEDVLIAMDSNLFVEEDPKIIFRLIDDKLNKLVQLKPAGAEKGTFRPYPADANYAKTMAMEGAAMDVMFANSNCTIENSARAEFLLMEQPLVASKEEVPENSDPYRASIDGHSLASDHMMLSVRLKNITAEQPRTTPKANIYTPEKLISDTG